jgi:hypothetical protein
LSNLSINPELPHRLAFTVTAHSYIRVTEGSQFRSATSVSSSELTKSFSHLEYPTAFILQSASPHFIPTSTMLFYGIQECLDKRERRHAVISIASSFDGRSRSGSETTTTSESGKSAVRLVGLNE